MNTVGISENSKIPLLKGVSNEPLALGSLSWSPSSNFQGLGRIRRSLVPQPRSKIVRNGRHYMRVDMVDRINVPLSLKFRTKREALKYFMKPVQYMRSIKQFNALFGSPDFNVKNVTTGRMRTKGTAFIFLFGSKSDDALKFPKLKFLKERRQSDTPYKLDLSDLNLKDYDA